MCQYLSNKIHVERKNESQARIAHQKFKSIFVCNFQFVDVNAVQASKDNRNDNRSLSPLTLT